MASLSISEALKIVHHRRQQQHGLWRLDSPTEAALVAQLCNRQRDEVAVISFGDPQPEEHREWQFAHLGPPYLKTDKKRHYYAVAQCALMCGFELAHQRGLLRTPLQQQQQPGQPDAVPCNPAGAAAPVCAAGDEQEPHVSCRTPMSQLRAEHQQQQQLEDCSPCNNIVRRLAADIQEGSSELRITLQGLSRRSISSLRSRTSTHSDGDQQERTTPLASPGRAWAEPPAASCTLEPLVFDLQGASTSVTLSPAHEYSAAAGPEQLLAASAHDHLGTHDSDDGCQPEDDSMHPPQGLAAGAVPIINGFGTAGGAHAQAALASTESTELRTPRLEPCWPSLHRNVSSSNGTAVSSEYSHFSSGGGSWGAATVQHSHAAAAPGTANEHTNKPAAAACGSASAKAGGVSADSAAQSRSRAEASTADDGDSGTGSSVDTDYSSCQDDDEDDGKEQVEFDCAAAGEPFCTPPPAARALSVTAGQPCQLPLSPQLLQQLTASFQEAGKRDTPLPEDDVTSCCDWATVCSYEEYE